MREFSWSHTPFLCPDSIPPSWSHAPVLIPAQRYQEAIEWYSKAIDLDPSIAVYYGNRSFAHLKMESYGYALSDATTALDIDRTYIKVQGTL